MVWSHCKPALPVLGFHFITSGFCSFRKQASNSKLQKQLHHEIHVWTHQIVNLWLFLQCFCRGLFGDLQPTASLKSLSWLSEMTHLKRLAERRLDTRPVKMNHAMQHMAPTVLFAGLLLLAQSDACCLWPAMAPDDEARHAGFLELCAAYLELHCSVSLCFLWNSADWWANSTEVDGIKKNKWIKKKYIYFFLNLQFYFFHFSGSFRRISKSSRSRCDTCLHNYSTQHWGFKRIHTRCQLFSPNSLI